MLEKRLGTLCKGGGKIYGVPGPGLKQGADRKLLKRGKELFFFFRKGGKGNFLKGF